MGEARSGHRLVAAPACAAALVLATTASADPGGLLAPSRPVPAGAVATVSSEPPGAVPSDPPRAEPAVIPAARSHERAKSRDTDAEKVDCKPAPAEGADQDGCPKSEPAPAPIEPPGRLRSPNMVTSGKALTIGGSLTSVAAGAFLAGAFASEDVGASFGLGFAGIVLLPVGAAMTAIGVPLWAVGSGELPLETAPRSTPELTFGVVLAGIGLTGANVGAALLLATDGEMTEAAFPTAAGALLTVAGVGLAMHGGEEVPSRGVRTRAVAGPGGPIPTVTLAPTSAALRWRF